MSFMDGFRVLEFIRQNDSFSDIPVIFMNNSNDTEMIELIENSTAVGYVNKPEISEEFFNFIAKYLRKATKF